MQTLPLSAGPSNLPASLWAYVRAVLRGETTTWPTGVTAAEAQALVTYLDGCGILPLLWATVHAQGAEQDWPASMVEKIEAGALLAAVAAQQRQAEVTRVLAALHAAGVRGLIFKGVALAHLVYPRPALRPAGDMDLLIEPADLSRTEQALLTLGYERGTHYLQQVMFVGARTVPFTALVDVHWASSDARVISQSFTFAELWARSVPVASLGPDAHTVSRLDALLMAAAHFAQHREWDRLIWLYDIHLLAASLSQSEEAQLMPLATTKRLRAVCGAALGLAHAYFGTQLGAGSLSDLVRGRWWWRVQEPSAHYLAQRHLLFHDFLLQMRGGDWPTRRRLIQRILLAPTGIRRLDGWDPPRWLRPVVHTHRRATAALQRLLHSND